MTRPCRLFPAAWLLVLFAVHLAQAPQAAAQFAQPPAELSSSVDLDEADSAVRAHLERASAYVADRQWDEAVETLRQVMENHGSKMIPLTATRYVNVTDYCHVQIASLPSEALALYRQRADALAQAWYEEGLATRNVGRLADVVDQMFCSSWGDDALWTLGEISLEQGHHGAARKYWERLIEIPPGRIKADRFRAARDDGALPADMAALIDKWYAADALPQAKWYELRGDTMLPDAVAEKLVQFWKEQRVGATRLAYPGTNLARADIRARLVLVSILEGALPRARDELAALSQLHPDAEGRIGGRSAKYVDLLGAMITAAPSWPRPAPTEDWLTFAGNLRRNRAAAHNLDLGAKAWEPIKLGEPIAADSANSRAYSLRRIGEDPHRLLSYYPLVVGNLLLVNNETQIFAFDLRTGEPAWPSDDASRPAGEIYAYKNSSGYAARGNRGIGVQRFTMTAHDGKLFARMGSQVTSRPLESSEHRPGYLLCLDLNGQGRAVWKPDGRLLPDDERWAFEGAPIVSGTDLYVVMRKSDVRPQVHVACFDAETGRRRWRTMICAAETPGAGQAEEISHNLLTLEQGTLYCNTNLGAVAALSARDGRLQWVALYPRARKATPDGQDKRTAHFYRDLNPCVYERGMLFVAPADCESIFALDAGSGEMLWQSLLPEDAVHLIGVGHGNLLASGDSLWWIDARRGKVVRHWPDTTPLGYGRGLLMGDSVVWPARDALYVFDQKVGAARAFERDPIPLAAGRGATGGNLVAADGLLIIAASDTLYGFHQRGAKPADERARVARRGQQPSGNNPTTTEP